jgi:hypothetical protein
MPKTILFQLGKLRSEKPKTKGDKINHAPITIKTINVHFIFLLYQNYKKEKREYKQVSSRATNYISYLVILGAVKNL